mgnify:CR=1 FL=1
MDHNTSTRHHAREMTAPNDLPLSRFTIVELNDAGMPAPLRLALSLAGKIAADLGATVLKLEPEGGDQKVPRGTTHLA